MYNLPMYGVQLVKEGVCKSEYKTITNPIDILGNLKTLIGLKDREYLVGLYLDTKNKVLGVSTISIGSLNASVVHPREVFKVGILLNASALILAHNHPSGDPTPSIEDNTVTERIKLAGQLLGIALLDHIIVSSDSYYSYMESGEI